MYIAPDSTIYLIKGTKNSADYQNSIWFPNKEAQSSYFMGKAYTSLSDQLYSRRTTGVLRVGLPIGTVFGTSYMMFKNTSFENKWFYAFVTNYEYVNNEATDVYFVIDELQTYLFDYTILQCMVERMSQPLSDNIGDNIIPEGIDTGEYYYDEIQDSNLLWSSNNSDWKIVIFTTLNNDGSAQSSIDGRILGGLYSGLNYYAYTANEAGVAAVNKYLSKVSECGAESSVVAITMIPSVLMNRIGGSDAVYNFSSTPANKLGSYTPRNKKLLTSPYYGMYVTNGQGAVASYALEYFANRNNPTFTLHFSLGAVSDCVLQPNGYRGGARQYGLELTGFPQCAYTTDGYKAWMARNSGFIAIAQTELERQNEFANNALSISQQGISIGMEGSRISQKYSEKAGLISGGLAELQKQNAGVGAITSGIGSILTGNILGLGQSIQNAYTASASAEASAQGAMNSINQSREVLQNQLAAARNQNAQIANSMAQNNAMTQIGIQKLAQQKSIASLTPPSFHGQSVGSASKQFGDFGYHIGYFRIREDYAKRADDYFDLFGYAQDRIMPPYRKTRKHWTYLKTRGANFENHNVPEDDMVAIQNLYDGGIRWWVNGDEIGAYNEYSADNTCLANPEL